MLMIRFRDKSGRGYASTSPISEYRNDPFLWTKDEEQNWNGESFSDWVLGDREDGDVWENSAERYEVIDAPFANVNLGDVRD